MLLKQFVTDTSFQVILDYKVNYENLNSNDSNKLSSNKQQATNSNDSNSYNPNSTVSIFALIIFKVCCIM